VIEERLHIGLEGLMVQQLQQDALKGLAIGFMLKLIAGKMDIVAPPASGRPAVPHRCAARGCRADASGSAAAARGEKRGFGILIHPENCLPPTRRHLPWSLA
jgi:hypothetical protein